jgi:hypothetical protein
VQDAPVDPSEARAVLGIAAGAEWAAVRAAYRQRIRAAHPDVAGPARGRDAARINEAYAVLLRARRAAPVTAPAATEPAPAPAAPRAPRVDRLGLHLAAPLADAFVDVLEAADTIGEITYVDRSSAILEVVLPVDGEACSFVASFHPTPGGVAVWCTLEALERVATLDPAPIVRRLAAALAGQTGSHA